MRGHVRKRGNKWSAVIFVGYKDDGKRNYKWFSGFDTKKEAEKFLASKVQEVNNGTFTKPSKQTVSAYLCDWLKFKQTQVRPNTFESYESRIRNHVIPALGNIQLANLRPQHLDEFYTTLVGKVSNRTIVHIHRILHDALGRAVKFNLIAKNPADVVDPPKAQQAKLGIWTRDQVIKFLRAADGDRYYVVYFLAITTGMRMGEILGLKWEDIDFEREELHVRRMVSFTTGKLTEHEPKTERSRRIIALPTETVNVLRQQKLLINEERLRSESYNYDGFVVAKIGGGVPWSQWIRQRYKSIIKDAGLPYIRIHDLRHTHASLLLEQGVHPKIVSERLGHSTIGITLDIYTHVLPSLQQKTAKDFGQALFGTKNA